MPLMEHGFALTKWFKIFELDYINKPMCVHKNMEFSIVPVW